MALTPKKVLFVIILSLSVGVRGSGGGHFLLLFRIPSVCPFTHFCSPWNPITSQKSKWSMCYVKNCVR